jgi:hypothetical protein
MSALVRHTLIDFGGRSHYDRYSYKPESALDFAGNTALATFDIIEFVNVDRDLCNWRQPLGHHQKMWLWNNVLLPFRDQMWQKPALRLVIRFLIPK